MKAPPKTQSSRRHLDLTTSQVSCSCVRYILNTTVTQLLCRNTRGQDQEKFMAKGGGSKSMDDHLTVERLLTDGMDAEPGKTGQMESRPRVDFCCCHLGHSLRIVVTAFLWLIT